jgi:lipid II:glycine glycyltransferase (peptidoglycan interpeptide bridge formation enzyme)
MPPASPISFAESKFTIKVDGINAVQWHALLQQFDDAGIYQTWTYGAVHWSPGQLSHITLERDGEVIAMVQLRIIHVPLIKKGIAYIRSGPVCRRRNEPFNQAALREIIKAVKDEYVDRRGLVLRMIPSVFESDPFAESFRSNLAAFGLKRNDEVRTYRTVRLDLTPSLQELRRRLSPKWRNKLNGAERNALTIREGASADLYDEFMTAYQEMMARKKFDTTVDVAEFKEIQTQLPDKFKMQVFLCENDGKILNALVVSAIGDTAVYLLGATSDEGLKLKGAYLLQWRAIQWLKERGCRWYDLGGIDPVQNPGVYEFKSGFSGEETSQLGTFELSTNWTSSVCVAATEQLQSVVRKFRG